MPRGCRAATSPRRQRHPRARVGHETFAECGVRAHDTGDDPPVDGVLDERGRRSGCRAPRRRDGLPAGGAHPERAHPSGALDRSQDAGNGQRCTPDGDAVRQHRGRAGQHGVGVDEEGLRRTSWRCQPSGSGSTRDSTAYRPRPGCRSTRALTRATSIGADRPACVAWAVVSMPCWPLAVAIGSGSSGDAARASRPAGRPLDAGMIEVAASPGVCAHDHTGSCADPATDQTGTATCGRAVRHPASVDRTPGRWGPAASAGTFSSSTGTELVLT